MMENWIRSPEVLNEFAEHFETGEKIPEDLMDKYLSLLIKYLTKRKLFQTTLNKFLTFESDNNF